MWNVNWSLNPAVASREGGVDRNKWGKVDADDRMSRHPRPTAPDRDPAP